MTPYFTRASFDFLSELAANNNRQWFSDNAQRYETTVREPALHFISDMADELAAISPHFRAIPKKVGGSMMRVQRDVRFSKDKRPYKTNIGIQFRHALGKDVHAPGFYLHVEPVGCFIGVGIWRPDAASLGKIRDAIVEKPEQWKAINSEKKFKNKFTIAGESLTNPPRGYAKDHPCIDDLKRKDFIAISDLEDQVVTSSKLKKQVVEHFRAASPYMAYLCHSLELNY